MLNGFDPPLLVWIVLGLAALFIFWEIIIDGVAVLVSRLPLVIGGVLIYFAVTQESGYSIWLLALGIFFVALGLWSYSAR